MENRVNVNGMELIYKINKVGVCYTISSKISILKEYDKIEHAPSFKERDSLSPKEDFLKNILKAIGEVPTLTRIRAFQSTINSWRRQEVAGHLHMENTFSVSRQKTAKVVVTFDKKIQDKEDIIQQLLQEIEVLKQAKELMEV